jgi:hypothetical protein
MEEGAALAGLLHRIALSEAQLAQQPRGKMALITIAIVDREMAVGLRLSLRVHGTLSFAQVMAQVMVSFFEFNHDFTIEFIADVAGQFDPTFFELVPGARFDLGLDIRR